jgi:hypothetical protein
MMTWHYVAVKKKDEYTVGEYFPGLILEDTANKTLPYTGSTYFAAESVEDLVRWLRIAADDIEKYGCVNEEDDV